MLALTFGGPRQPQPVRPLTGPRRRLGNLGIEQHRLTQLWRQRRHMPVLHGLTGLVLIRLNGWRGMPGVRQHHQADRRQQTEAPSHHARQCVATCAIARAMITPFTRQFTRRFGTRRARWRDTEG